jgi:hypothetical protein
LKLPPSPACTKPCTPVLAATLPKKLSGPSALSMPFNKPAVSAPDSAPRSTFLKLRLSWIKPLAMEVVVPTAAPAMAAEPRLAPAPPKPKPAMAPEVTMPTPTMKATSAAVSNQSASRATLACAVDQPASKSNPTAST